jgi:hypothetical protein
MSKDIPDDAHRGFRHWVRPLALRELPELPLVKRGKPN